MHVKYETLGPRIRRLYIDHTSDVSIIENKLQHIGMYAVFCLTG